jgi:LAS superfamily LD-carboxypeptidase LdcB
VAHQKRLWEAALKKYGSAATARKWVAPPGHSNHGKGIAADLHAYGTVLDLKAGGKVGAATKWAHANAGKFGLHFPLSNEDWHIEPKGSRG